MKKIFRQLILVAVIIFIIVFVFDSVVMPVYVHNKNIVQVPNVVGFNFDEAVNILESQKFRIVKFTGSSNNKIPFNHVISQNPVAFRKVKEGRDIYLTVASTKSEVRVPHLIGKTLREATFSLESAGLQLGEIIYQLDTELPKGTITSQATPPGTLLFNEAKVGVQLNSLPEVPVLIDSTE